MDNQAERLIRKCHDIVQNEPVFFCRLQDRNGKLKRCTCIRKPILDDPELRRRGFFHGFYFSSIQMSLYDS